MANFRTAREQQGYGQVNERDDGVPAVNQTTAFVTVNDKPNPDLQMAESRVLILFTVTRHLKIVRLNKIYC
jgi:hypothetical protein